MTFSDLVDGDDCSTGMERGLCATSLSVHGVGICTSGVVREGRGASVPVELE